MRGIQEQGKNGRETLIVPGFRRVGIPKPSFGRIGTDVLGQQQQGSIDRK